MRDCTEPRAHLESNVAVGHGFFRDFRPDERVKFLLEIVVNDIPPTTGVVDFHPNDFVVLPVPCENELRCRFKSADDRLIRFAQSIRELTGRAFSFLIGDTVVRRTLKILAASAAQFPDNTPVVRNSEGVTPNRAYRPASCGDGLRLRTVRHPFPTVNNRFQFVKRVGLA